MNLYWGDLHSHCAVSYSVRHEFRLRPSQPGPGFVYLRVRQADGHAAWASPIWFE